MYIKIYFNNKPLFLCDAIDNTIQPYMHHDDAIFMDELNSHTVKTIIHEMQQPQVHVGVFYHSNLDELKKIFIKKFILVQAAGGLVKNDKDEILMIFRRGYWDLPKGKQDSGEKLETCAIREVKEETGLKNISLDAALTMTNHTYHEGTKHILKETHWFAMSVKGEQSLVPQVDEDISEIKWVSQSKISSFLEKAYPIISDIIQAAKEKDLLPL